MTGGTETLDKARTLLEKRRAELQDELKQVDRALVGLGGRRGPGRPRGTASSSSGSGTVKRRRRKGGTRAEQAVKIVKANPGIGVSDIAKKMKLNAPNYLYRVLPDLESEGKIRRSGTKYYPGR